MDNLDDTETNAKVSDSAYSNSCSNSQSRRSHSSKSTHSGSSGSSGYGGKPSTSGYSANNQGQAAEKRSKDKDSKKKKTTTYLENTTEVNDETNVAEMVQEPETQSLAEVKVDAMPTKPPALAQKCEADEIMDTSVGGPINTKDKPDSINTTSASSSVSLIPCSRSVPNSRSNYSDSFSCVISMHDGVVIYTTSTLTSSLGFPKHLWIGRSFIDFVHPRDRSTFASQITRGLAVPKNGMQEKVPAVGNSVSAMVCRIRKYRGLKSGFGVKERPVTFVPFLLKLSFKNITDEEGKVTYLVIQATQFTSAFKVPNEVITNAVPFVIRHSANGILEYIEPEAVPYLGFLPQDLAEHDALQLYHSDDLTYLRQVYETIVKEGGVARSNPYRMLTQNGDYLKVETEWSSFINPWSKKLEFVIGKHHVVEGPATPDVFRAPKVMPPVSEEEKNKLQEFRDTMVMIMNEVLTKPAEAAKKHMSKRCQDVASFMESLIEDEETLPKTQRELRLEIHDPDQSYYERDSVMLGGISPHHDHSDSKSGTETPLSYNQLNYNDNLQRYFDSHQPFSYEDYHTVTGENILGLKHLKPIGPRACISPVAQHSAVDSGDLSVCESVGMTGSASSAGAGPTGSAGELQAPRLTENLLCKHNAEMEKELMKIHRVNRSSSKGGREKASETRQKKKEHLARCNTPFHVSLGPLSSETQAAHGVKRASKNPEVEGISRKHHCPSQRNARRRQLTTAEPLMMSSTLTTTEGYTPATTTLSSNAANGMNAFLLGFGFPHPKQMSIMTPVSSMPGIFPLYYAPGPMHRGMNSEPMSTPQSSTSENTQQYQHQPMMQCVMYGGAICGSPFMYSPMGHPTQQPYSLQENLMAQTLQFSNSLHYRNNNQPRSPKPSTAPKPNAPLKMKQNNMWRDKVRKEATAGASTPLKHDLDSNESQPQSNVMGQGSGEKQSGTQDVNENSDDVSSPNTYNNKSSEVTSDQRPLRNPKTGRSEEIVDKTDGESSYSSFYSSFFKTDSGSAEDSVDLKKHGRVEYNRNQIENTSSYRTPQPVKKIVRRKMEPPWMEQVCVTSELIYKYQIIPKSLEEVLTADKQKMSNMEQPSLVNEQLDQLYVDLHLEGVASRLTLEEGITSSSSSGEESNNKEVKTVRRKREYSKLVMVYEEDAPLPTASSEEDVAEDEPVFS